MYVYAYMITTILIYFHYNMFIDFSDTHSQCPAKMAYKSL